MLGYTRKVIVSVGFALCQPDTHHLLRSLPLGWRLPHRTNRLETRRRKATAAVGASEPRAACCASSSARSTAAWSLQTLNWTTSFADLTAASYRAGLHASRCRSESICSIDHTILNLGFSVNFTASKPARRRPFSVDAFGARSRRTERRVPG